MSEKRDVLERLGDPHRSFYGDTDAEDHADAISEIRNLRAEVEGLKRRLKAVVPRYTPKQDLNKVRRERGW